MSIIGGLVAKSCLTFCDPMDCSPPGSSDHWIFQARILEWVAISSFNYIRFVRYKKGTVYYFQLSICLWSAATSSIANIFKARNFRKLFNFILYFIFDVFKGQ